MRALVYLFPLSGAVMRPSLVALALLLPAPALAGGVGLVATGGLHAERVYYYSLDEQTGGFKQQDPVNQVIPNFGGGVELILGDRDDKILGVFRGYYLMDSPQSETPDMKGSTYNIRSAPRDVGMISGGLQWGLVGAPTGLQLTLYTGIGSGFLTNDFTEFLTAEIGVGGTYTIQRRIQVHAELTGGLRYRKRFYHTENLTLGVRYLFD